MELYQINENKLTIKLHFGQTRAWESKARFPAIIAGTQSGKTSFTPIWLQREIKNCGPGDYLAVTANYDLFKLKLLPEMRRYFESLLGWTYAASDRVFNSPESISTPGQRTIPQSRIILRSAKAEGGLESASVNAAVLDEFGHPDVKVEAWEAVQRRLSLSMGRALFSTTPYNMGYLKTEVFDRWKAGDTDFDVINFKSTMNPAFPQEEYDRMRQKLPLWKFKMFYDGIFERPAGLIYDVFIRAKHTTPAFKIPDTWQRYLGLDFGGVNTAGVFFAEHPTDKKLYLYRAYKAGGLTAEEHTRELLRGEPMIPISAGGAPSEDQWRDEFKAAGLPVRRPPIKDVEVGIDRVYDAHKQNQIIVFDNVKGYLEEKETYARELDDAGEPTEKIADKHSFHFMDAERYIISYVKRKGFKMHYDSVDFYNPPARDTEKAKPARTEQEIERMLERANQ